MASDVGCFLKCFPTICISALKNSLFSSTAYFFLIGLFVFSEFSFLSPLYIPVTVYQMYSWQIFSPILLAASSLN